MALDASASDQKMEGVESRLREAKSSDCIERVSDLKTNPSHERDSQASK